MLEKVFCEICRIYKAKPQELPGLKLKSESVFYGDITLFFNTWKIIFQKTSDSCAISAIPDLPVVRKIDQELIEKWELIMESKKTFNYPGPAFGKQMQKYILEALEEYPTKKVVAIREAIKSALMSPETSRLYAFYKFKA